jgi:hypothetical protein
MREKDWQASRDNRALFSVLLEGENKSLEYDSDRNYIVRSGDSVEVFTELVSALALYFKL